MPQNLAITIRLHDGRYHGMGEWLPSPARLFQALVSGAARGRRIDDASIRALERLEALRPPAIGAPRMRTGQRVETFVPNNDIDAKGGDLGRVGDIRASKTIEPKLFDPELPFIFVWTLKGGEEEARDAHTICALAERLYQFGRGVDMAWAWGEILDNEELETRLSSYPGLVHLPSDSGSGKTLACPRPGSLASLEERYAASSQRFKAEGQGKTVRQLFSQPPKPRFMQVAYESPPSRRVYELRQRSSEASFGVWPLARASRLVVWLRDGAVERLRRALPDCSSEIERILVGRKADGADEGPTSLRVKIVPLPSIGHHHADRGIRRVLLEVPAGCPLRADDVHWAFSGLDFVDQGTGEVLDLILTPSGDETMLAHYGVAGLVVDSARQHPGGQDHARRHYGTSDHVRYHVWRTVTPAVLPEKALRRQISPACVTAEAKVGAEYAAQQARAAAAVAQALRYAAVHTHPEVIRVQREPFEAKGECVEAFAPGTRFAKERLWHVEITFNAPIAGPLVIGDGRFLGLGVMAPVNRARGVHVFVVEGGLDGTPQPTEVARSLRRAAMARVQDVLGPRSSLPTFFTGHERDGSPAQTEQRPHLTFLFDPGRVRLLILAPHVLDRRDPTCQEIGHLRDLDAALTDFRELRVGSAGRLKLRATSIDPEGDPLFAASRTWESVTPYQVTRHTKHVGAAEALSADLCAECRRRGLPEPHVTPREPRGVPGVGLVGEARLTFQVAVKGPIVLGRSRHLAGGLFAGVKP